MKTFKHFTSNDFNLRLVTDAIIDGVDIADYPDFCDVYVMEALYDGEEMTEDELDYLTEAAGEFVSELVHKSFY